MENTYIFYKIAEFIQEYKTFLCFSVICKTASAVCDPVRKYLGVDFYIASDFHPYEKSKVDQGLYNLLVINPQRDGMIEYPRPQKFFIIKRGQL